MRMSIEQCGKETHHALVVGTGFCTCTHAMFDYDPLLDTPPQDAVIERFRDDFAGRQVTPSVKRNETAECITE